MRVYGRLTLVTLCCIAICVLAACGSRDGQRIAQRQVYLHPPSPGPPLTTSDIETLISKALQVAIAEDTVLARQDTVLVLSTVRIYHPPDSSVAESFSEAALPASQSPRFLLLSSRQADEMRASGDLHYVEIESIAVSGDEVAVGVLVWSVPSREHTDAGWFAAAEGPMVVFRRAGSDWAFVNAAMWHSVN